jgi:hypothetical protein
MTNMAKKLKTRKGLPQSTPTKPFSLNILHAQDVLDEAKRRSDAAHGSCRIAWMRAIVPVVLRDLVGGDILQIPT